MHKRSKFSLSETPEAAKIEIKSGIHTDMCFDNQIIDLIVKALNHSIFQLFYVPLQQTIIF